MSRPQGHSEAGGIRLNEISNGLIGNPTQDMPACNTVALYIDTHASIGYLLDCNPQCTQQDVQHYVDLASPTIWTGKRAQQEAYNLRNDVHEENGRIH
jgi:hypothetical protein